MYEITFDRVHLALFDTLTTLQALLTLVLPTPVLQTLHWVTFLGSACKYTDYLLQVLAEPTMSEPTMPLATSWL